MPTKSKKQRKKEPRNYLPLFVDDLENEESLKLVSDSAWKLWIRIIAYTWCKSPKQGYLLTKAGAVPTTEELSRLFLLSETHLKASLLELEKERVFDRSSDGAIVCRRQVKESKLSKSRSKSGARGARNRWSNFAMANGIANTIATPGGGGGYILDPSPSLFPDQDPDHESKPHAIGSPSPVAVSPERGVELWHEICVPVGFAKVAKLTPKRRANFLARLRERDEGRPRDEAWVRMYLGRIAASNFCAGGGPTQWRADFDFAFRSEDVVVKVLEGKYDDRGTGPTQRARPAKSDPNELITTPTGEHNRRVVDQFLARRRAAAEPEAEVIVDVE